MPLQTVHRPTDFNGLYGNEPAKESLISVLNRDKDVPRVYLFTGPAGCGKTTLALILRNKLGCSDIDTYIYNAANTRGIDTIREIAEMSKLAPMRGKYKIYILDECHQITPQAQEALLLTLENPPTSCFFVLCTTDPEKLKETLKRRCHICELKSLTRVPMYNLLQDVLKKEGITDFPQKVIQKIMKSSQGSAGIALSLLDSVKNIKEEEMALKMIEDVTIREASVMEICRKLVFDESKGINKYRMIQPILEKLEGDPEQIRYAILGYMNKIMRTENPSTRVLRIGMCFTDSYIYVGQFGLTASIYAACDI